MVEQSGEPRSSRRAGAARTAAARDDRPRGRLGPYWPQLIPSITAPTATSRMANVAVTAVRAVATKRSSRRRPGLESADRGKAIGIAGRTSTGIGYLQVLKVGTRSRAERYGHSGDSNHRPHSTAIRAPSVELSPPRRRAFAAIRQGESKRSHLVGRAPQEAGLNPGISAPAWVAAGGPETASSFVRQPNT
jgi:hypothetical protein